jgi:hypothetical protein
VRPRGLDPEDIDAVRSALHRVRDSDDLLGIDEMSGDDEEVDQRRSAARDVRRTLVDELIGFLEAREDIIDLQVRDAVDQHLLGPEPW